MQDRGGDTTGGSTRSAALLRAVLDGCPDAIVVLDAQRRVVLANPAAGRLFGEDPDQLVGRPVGELSGFGGAGGTAFPGSDTVASGHHAPPVLSVRRADGTAVVVEVGVAALSGADGSGWVLTLHDVTGRADEEARLREALAVQLRVAEELRHVDGVRTTFIRAVSHELRTPLTAITGYSQTLSRGVARLDDDTRDHLLRRLEVRALELDRMLGDLLDVDRLSAGTVEPVRRWLDVPELCRAVIERIECASHPITCTGEGVRAKLDAAKVERIVENLVRNAVKHTTAGTPIVVEVESDGTIGGVVLSVTDRGPGIPPDLVDSIFDPFVMGPDSAAAADPGTGIGLSLVARFAELHGGNAWVERDAGGGTVFRAWLPGDLAGHTDDPGWSPGATPDGCEDGHFGPPGTPVLSYPSGAEVPVASWVSRP